MPSRSGVPIQSVDACREAVATAVGCTVDAVRVNVTFLGGSFGRKIVPDYVVQAVQASKAVGRPVKLIRTREQDTQHDVFRPNAGARLRAVLDDEGYPLAVHARVAGQSLFGATRKSWLDRTPEGSWDESMVDGIYNQSYRMPNFLVETVDTPLPIPVYFMRSVGSTAAVFFWESFISELASRPGSTNTSTAAICWPPIRSRCGCSMLRRRRRIGSTPPPPDRVSWHRVQLLHRPRRPLQNLCRGSGGAGARRTTSSRSSASSAPSIRAWSSIRTRSRRRSKAASALP